MDNSNKYIFREIGGLWLRVDSREPKPLILADFLQQLNVEIDEGTQFCRIYKNGYKIEFRHYGGQIRINVSETRTY